ncbi:MAG TPA: aldehyde dehydrogenase family protein, partial [Pseudonocardiaceae bacterium]
MPLPRHDDLVTQVHDVLAAMSVPDPFTPDGDLSCRTPITGAELGRIRAHRPDQVRELIGQAAGAFEQWRSVPPPVRGNLIREFGNLLREHKE